MKSHLYLLLICLSMLSCNQIDNVSFGLMSKLEYADSLYRSGEFLLARDFLENVVNTRYILKEPSVIKKLWWICVSEYETNISAQYYDYYFSYIAQLDALDMLVSYSKDPLEKVHYLKMQFSLAPELDRLIEQYIQSCLNERHYSRYRAYKPFRDRYDIYRNRVHPIRVFAGDEPELSKYLYRRKWMSIDSFLLVSDSLYGYDNTFAYLDSVLCRNGASLESYTKALVKSYMSFSGELQYAYDSRMNYADFKVICKHPGDWYITRIQSTNHHSTHVFYDYEDYIDDTTEGFIIEFDDYSLAVPTIFKDVSFYYESHHMTTLNDTGIHSIEFSESNRYKANYIVVNIDIPNLSALLLKNGKKGIVDELANSKQYYLGDTLVREGYENDLYYIARYNDRLNLTEKSIFSKNKVPICDSSGVHRYLYDYKFSNRVICEYFDDKLCLRKSDYARKIIEDDAILYYDWNSRLYKKVTDTTELFFKYRDSTVITFTNDLKRECCIVDIKHDDHMRTGPYDTSSYPNITRELITFNDYYDYEKDYIKGDKEEVYRYMQDGTYYCGTDIPAIERYWYDDNGRVSDHATYDYHQNLLKAISYEYTGEIVKLYHYNSQRELESTTIKKLPLD